MMHEEAPLFPAPGDHPLLRVDEATVQALAQGHIQDPFSVLGPHEAGEERVLRAFLPGARAVSVIARDDGRPLATLVTPQHPALFVGFLRDAAPYRLRVTWPGDGGAAVVDERADPYSFGPILGDLDLHLIAEGRHHTLWQALGSHPRVIDGVEGVSFAVWAPNAMRVSVVGDFNAWDGRRHPMRLRHAAGVWEIFIPGLRAGERYKYEIVARNGDVLPLKADPVALATEPPPATASIVPAKPAHHWTDADWMAGRAARHAPDAPIAIYEVHSASWLRKDDGSVLGWDDLAERLVPYVAEMGFTHVELMPIMEHPFGGSWGYQPLGLFAPTARHGGADGFARFVDACHTAGVGVILDWVPAHFPSDVYGLAQFDGTALYEHSDPREGYHPDWNTLIYNLGRREVAGFLIASALFWLQRFHVDGLRVDAVASMLYRDYSRAPGEWVPNIHGGRENLEAVAFLKHLNAVIAEACPGAMTIAEESTAWPGVSRPVDEDGLGFSYKWNMGWMHDTLQYIERDPVHRSYHHDEIGFGLVYAFSEKFVLPLSHDEVVHGKHALIGKMPGDRWQRFANLRAYLGFMWTHPGKKLLFMGGEIAQEREWDHDRMIDWDLISQPEHGGMQRLMRDLNHVYRSQPALHQLDCEGRGFRWIVGDDRANSVFAFLRLGREASPVLVVVNMTPVPHTRYRIGVPQGGRWAEIFNSDAAIFGGSNMGNAGGVAASGQPSHGEPFSVSLTIPPLATVLFTPET
ncbi:1,4-alpha-glucan branching enzyme [Chelatococcus asaccharovorans]|nr:1,4-alpha-glucan branching protein GlgB [Chelatococcus asaccharovorans]CAH1651436.1 1,4-alpha-glucan branching enzyme [Chelatococcus asaccharovorans]CAH1692919.1 1,4-alpha-glucan branching enzyme [Chelatococcus asaccharovorans]